ncbi:glycosyltransferase [Spirulina sp. 06S082]|uniref:glycosyltransferase n=1 Tax=Spirulina sp. 06S082 TaxID=3110248 RepID=UPI002B1F8332|nr:glycosyltransferase [Spirulina sp. 06S082]MEA5467575.1 glycosyltransferase [Spirulina sp. 06S082]
MTREEIERIYCTLFQVFILESIWRSLNISHLPKISIMFNSPSKRPGFLLLFPNIFGFKGGMQVYSTFFLQALQHLYPHARYRVFLKYDRTSPPHIPVQPQTHFTCLGKFPRWLQSLLLLVSTIIAGIVERPHLVIATHLNYGIPCYWLKRLTGTPYWIVVHGLEGWDLAHPQRQQALRHADRVLAVSRYTRDRLLAEQNLDRDRVVILPNTILSEEFQPAPKPSHLLQRYGLTPEQPTILTVTRLGKSARYKGYDRLLQALVKIRQQMPNVRYILGGKGDDLPRIQNLVEKLGLQDCVTLAGFIADEELCDHYNLCDVFALPSTGEGFGIVYLEALACGKPVLGGDRDGTVEPLDYGKYGCLVNPEDTEAIADNLMAILQGTHPNRTLFKPEILRQKALERFDFPQFCQILAQHLESSRSFGDRPIWDEKKAIASS